MILVFNDYYRFFYGEFVIGATCEAALKVLFEETIAMLNSTDQAFKAVSREKRASRSLNFIPSDPPKMIKSASDY